MLVELAQPALERGERVNATLPITNADRAVGATLSGEIARRYGNVGLPEETISFRFTGSAGQSFGAFAARGLSLDLEGEANDYVGKGLSGGRLIVRHPRSAQFIPEQTVLIGNTVLYGATSGEAYFAAVAGEHCCEYMTGRTVVVLGRTGRNFGAGMSGGMAYVLDEFGELERQCNMGLVELAHVTEFGEREVLRELIEQHARYTGSARAKRALGHWERAVQHFVAVVPREYRQALERGAIAGWSGAAEVPAARRQLAMGDDTRSARHG